MTASALFVLLEDLPRAGRSGLVLFAVVVSASAPPAVAALPVATPSGHGPDPVSVNRSAEEPVHLALPSAWCGTPRSDDDIEHELPNGDYKYHAVYVLPADGIDGFAAAASKLQVDALQASSLIERLYGRALRFDMGTSCGPQFLDISTVRLRSSSAELAALVDSSTESVFNRVAAELRAGGFPVLGDDETAAEAAAYTKNLLVWLDGPGPPGVCGEATVYDDPTRAEHNWNNFGGKVALIYRVDGTFCNSNTVRHEIGHNLGAIQPGAPNTFDGAHCEDAYEDTMCYSHAPRRATGEHNALFFDYGNDDYWDPPGAALPHWTVNLSRFVCASLDCNVPGGSASGGLLDSDNDTIPDGFDGCPSTPGTTCGASADTTRPEESFVRARLSMRRLGRKRWSVRVRTSGRGRARIQVRCGRRTKYVRVIRVPGTFRARLRCRTRPRVSAAALAPDEPG